MTLHHIILCIIQSITEFLPISSSSHLKIYNQFTELSLLNLEIEVALHAGTLMAVLIYFFKDLLNMLLAICSVFIPKYQPYALKCDNFTMFISLFIATIPAIVIGFCIKKMNITFDTKCLLAYNLIGFGFLLYICDKQSNQYKTVSYFHAFIIGLAQTLAFIPGVSRSGICLTFSRLFNINRSTSMHFTFLLSIPTVLGAVTLTFLDMLKQKSHNFDWDIVLWMTLLTALLGLIVIKVLFKFIQNRSFKIFAFYRIALGAILLWWWR